MPRGLTKGAQRFWHRMAPRLATAGLLTGVDVPAASLMAEHWALATEVARIIEQEGYQVEDDKGLLRKHPLLQVLRDQSAAFRAYAAEFGMTPSSRSRITVSEPEGEDPFEAYMAEMREAAGEHERS